MHLFMHLCQRKKSFIKIPTLICEVKGTVWVGLEHNVISTETVGRFDM